MGKTSRLWVWVIAVTAISWTAAADAQPQKGAVTSKQLYAAWGKSVVTIRTEKGSGTGFFDSDGTLFTAYHVIKGASKATVVFSDGFKVDAFWVGTADDRTDIATLVTDGYKDRDKREKGAKLGDWAGCQVGDRLTVIGSPQGLTGSVTEGLLSGKRKVSDVDYLQLSASVSPGSSGSPVFDAKGRIVGMVVGGRQDGQQLNFAISCKDLKEAWAVPMSLLSPSQDLEESEWTVGERLTWVKQAEKWLSEAHNLISRLNYQIWSTKEDFEMLEALKPYWYKTEYAAKDYLTIVRLLAKAELEPTTNRLFVIYDQLLRIQDALADAADYDTLYRFSPKLGTDFSVELIEHCTRLEAVRRQGFDGLRRAITDKG